MESGSISKRYARALLDLATEHKEVEPIYQDLESLWATITGSPDLHRFATDPTFTRDNRVAVMREVVKGRVRPMTENFVHLLARRGRVGLLGDILISYGELMDKAAGVVRAEVTSAGELSAEVEKELQTALQQLVGKTVILRKKVDPNVLGGVVTRVGNVLYDGSLASQLRRMRAELLEKGL